ncbi:MAG: hypothetical protein ACI4OO_09025 [Otoolea sp.]|nr:hypothetical protein [Lachnospiraceae bacterium]
MTKVEKIIREETRAGCCEEAQRAGDEARYKAGTAERNPFLMDGKNYHLTEEKAKEYMVFHTVFANIS